MARFNPAILNQIEALAYYFGGLDARDPSFTDGELSTNKFSEFDESFRRQVLVLFSRASSAGVFSADVQAAIARFVMDPIAFADQEEGLGDTANKYSSIVGVNGFQTSMEKMIGGEPSSAGTYPTKFQPGLSAIQVFPIKHNFASRNSDVLDVFFNSIPNTEFSRCVPFFDLSVISPGAPVASSGMSLSLSQHAFLSPNDALTPGQKEKANASTVSDAEGDALTEYRASGMELFTSPQTLVNGDEEYFEPGTSESGGVGVLDKFKPFMTIKNFTVSKTPSGMNTEHETAKLQIALHDRSRLSQVASLVAPTAYRATEILVEYGWSHPDGQNSPGTNPIGDFLNALRTRVKYGIKNSSYSFTPDGGVDINLELSMKGVNETFTAEITDGEGFSRLEDKLAQLNAVFAEKVNELYDGRALVKDVIGQTAIKASSSTSSALKLDKATADEIAKTIALLKRGEGDARSGVEELATLFTKLFGTDGTDGEVKQTQQSAADAFKIKMSLLKNNEDFFASSFPKPGISDGGPVQPWSAAGYSTPAPGYCSLGKLLLLFVGKPLQATSQFDEVQFIFYGVNRSAGFVRHHNISQFPIKIQDFEDLMKARFGKALNIDIQTFIGFINKEFIKPQYAEAYGLNGLYDIKIDKEGKRTIKTAGGLDDSALVSSKQQILAKAYAAEEPKDLKTVDMSIFFDCVPAASPREEGEGFDVDVNKTILRLYVTDLHAAGIDPVGMLLQSMTPDGLNVVTSGNVDDQLTIQEAGLAAQIGAQDISSGHGALHAEFLAKADAAGLLELQQTNDIEGSGGKTKLQGIMKVVPNRGKLKEFIRQQMPSCIIGSTGCPVYNASLSSMNDPRLGSIEMGRITKGDSKNVGAMAGNIDTGLPTFVKPNELAIEMFGLPTLRYQTIMFFDFNTDTNADGMYCVTSVDHSFTPGEYKTSAKLINYSGFEKFKDPIEDVKRRLADMSAEMDRPSE